MSGKNLSNFVKFKVSTETFQFSSIPRSPHYASLLGFRMVNGSNWFAGCEPIYPLKPQEYNISSKIKLISIQATNFYGNNMDTYNAYHTLEQYKEICMIDARSKAFAYRLDGMGKCFPKGSMFNGIQPATSTSTVYIKVSSAFPYNSSEEAVKSMCLV